MSANATAASEEVDQFSDESWNKIEGDGWNEVEEGDDDFGVDTVDTPEMAAVPSVFSSFNEPVMMDHQQQQQEQFPDRVDATGGDNEESEGTYDTDAAFAKQPSTEDGAVASMKDTNEPSTTTTATKHIAEEDVHDAAEPAPVMSPAETVLPRASAIRSPEIVSPGLASNVSFDLSNTPSATVTTTATSSIRSSTTFPSMNLALPPHFSGAAAAASTSSAVLPPLQDIHAVAAGMDSGSGPAATIDTTGTNTSLLDSATAISPTANFAHVIRERTRQRRLKDDAAVASLRVQVTRLEAALAATCRRRVDSIRAIADQATSAVQELETRLSAQVKADIGRVNERLNGLEQRMSALETRWNDDVCGINDDLVHGSAQLQSQLSSLQHAVAHERVQATTRHERLVQQIQGVAATYEERWQDERQDRMAAVLALQETMDTVHSERELNVATIEGQLQEELRQLQAAVALEQHERRAHDDEIVQSLNRYTRYIQESLAATTGVAMTAPTAFGGTGSGGGGSGYSNVDYDSLTLR